jgi:hypothetical protein
MDDQAPPIPLDLLNWLDTRFPERTPSLDCSIDLVRYMTGQRDVVRFLRHKYAEQNERDFPSQD